MIDMKSQGKLMTSGQKLVSHRINLPKDIEIGYYILFRPEEHIRDSVVIEEDEFEPNDIDNWILAISSSYPGLDPDLDYVVLTNGEYNEGDFTI